MNRIIRHVQSGYDAGQGRASSWAGAWLLYYSKLQLREQRLILVAAVLLPLMILIFGIMLPMLDRQKTLQAELATLEQQAAEARLLAERLAAKGSQQKNGGMQENLMAVVERLARQGQVRQYMNRIRPQPSADGGNQSLMLQLKDVPYKLAINFIDAMARESLGLSSIKIQAGKEAGLVHLQAVIING